MSTIMPIAVLEHLTVRLKSEWLLRYCPSETRRSTRMFSDCSWCIAERRLAASEDFEVNGEGWIIG